MSTQTLNQETRPTETIQEDRTMSVGRANLLSIAITFPVLILSLVVYLGLWQDREPTLNPGVPMNDLLWAALVLIGGIVLHELIHGITWAIAGRKPWRTIKFGIVWKMFTPYCHLTVPVGVNAYRLGTLMPGVLTGLIPLLVGILLGNDGFFSIGLFFTLAAGGDALILWMLRDVSQGSQVQDHPSEIGCMVLK